MDYIRISSLRVSESPSHQGLVAEVNGQQTTDNRQQTLSTSVEEIKNLLKDWIKLYPNSFAPDVDFKIYQLADGDIIIQLHEDLSSMAVSLLVLYFETTINRQQSTDIIQNSATQQLSNIEAYITIDDTEVLLKQNEGKRAMVFCGQQPTAVRFLLEDNYVLDYNFEKRAQPVKNCDLVFEEPEFSLPEEYESVRVGDVVKKKIDEVLEEGLTPTKLLIYFLCGAIGLSIGFLIVYFMSK